MVCHKINQMSLILNHQSDQFIKFMLKNISLWNFQATS